MDRKRGEYTPERHGPACARSGAQLDEDRAILHAGGKAGHAHRGIVDVGAGGHVPAPGVPGADHDGALEIAVAERAAAMAARVVDRVVRPLDVEDRERAAAGLHDPSLAGGNLPCRGHADPMLVAHGLDRKSTRLNSSHGYISYAVFCLK